MAVKFKGGKAVSVPTYSTRESDQDHAMRMQASQKGISDLGSINNNLRFLPGNRFLAPLMDPETKELINELLRDIQTLQRSLTMYDPD